jgi:ATP-binding cassette, subfamily B, bacterial PglK
MKKNIYIELLYYLRNILNYKQKKSAAILLILMVVGMILEIFLLKNLLILLNFLTNPNTEIPEIILKIGEIFSTNKNTILVLLLFIATFLTKTLISILVRWKESKFIFSLKAQISEKLFFGYIKLPFIFHQRTNTAKILKNIIFEVDQFSVLIFATSTFLLELMVLMGISFYLFSFDFNISFFCILAFIIFGYFFNLFNKKKLKTMSIERLKHQDGRIKSIMEGLAGMREIKLWAKENDIIKNFSLHNDSIARISTSTTLRNALSKPSFEIFMLFFLSIFLLYFISNNLLTASVIPIFGIYLAAAYRLVPSISQIVQSIQTIQFTLKCAKNLSDDIEQFNKNEKDRNKSNKPISFQKILEIENLNFAYKSDDHSTDNHVLKNVNLKIKKGDLVGIQGESGSGKSTFIDLFIGLHELHSGQILIDGKNIKENLKKWQSLIGCVPQEVFILDDTLKKNIAFGIPEHEISDEKIEKCIEFSNLKNFLLSLDKKTNTIIGEKGSRLSGGQKQRIGIARAMYNNPEILIFDEATSSLDVETESKIISEINSFKRKKTVIIVSHNKEILKKCDYIFEIKNRKLEKNV